MRITTNRENDILILGIIGKLDAATSKDFQEIFLEFIDKGDTKFIIDCSQLDYISSAGIRVFYFILRKLENKDSKIVFCALNNNIKRVFDIVDLPSDFPIFSSIDDAYEGFSGK
jgi:anti-anti-sigma factor